MLRLLEFLWTGCWHKWETIETGCYVEEPGGLGWGLWFHERCTKCGINRQRNG